MLEKSLAALACAWLGKQNNDAGLLKYGVQLYNVAIRQMASLITRDAYSDDIIYTTVLFQEIEVSWLEVPFKFTDSTIFPLSDLIQFQDILLSL